MSSAQYCTYIIVHIYLDYTVWHTMKRSLLNMHSDIEINPDKVVRRFVKQQPRSMFRDSIIFDD